MDRKMNAYTPMSTSINEDPSEQNKKLKEYVDAYEAIKRSPKTKATKEIKLPSLDQDDAVSYIAEDPTAEMRLQSLH